ncbi:MAG TPA: alternative ribosome rescue aminoacyl-tRNA hydrolase ArfB [Planctomycetota bacterium]|nr:alternative ribosome rescue aminoacyl-tRNA hydrolase ArfB [Planctomycetota bacterium]
MEPLRINSRLVIPPRDLSASYARSGGPGGQNINKVSTKVVLRFSVTASEALGERRRQLLSRALGQRLTTAGELVIHASRHRTRARNLEDARQRLADILAAALRPRTTRKATRPTRASNRKRLERKQRRGDLKRSRRPPADS